MDECVIKEVNTKGYNKFLLCLTFESIINYLCSIESYPTIVNCSGKMLIDQLLVTGNGNNRFISCTYNNGKLDLATAFSVQPDEYFRNLAVELLNDNYDYVEHSILTESQRQCVRNRIMF